MRLQKQAGPGKTIPTLMNSTHSEALLRLLTLALVFAVNEGEDVIASAFVPALEAALGILRLLSEGGSELNVVRKVTLRLPTAAPARTPAARSRSGSASSGP